MRCYLGNEVYAYWNGGHQWTFQDDLPEHLFTFGWEKSRITQQEALQALLDHLKLLDEEDRADCAGCVDAAEMAALGWDDYYCRKHKEKA